MKEKKNSVLTKRQKKSLVVHASNLMDFQEGAELSGSHILDLDFVENHVNKFDRELLVSAHKTIKKNRKIMDYPVPAFLSSCPKSRSDLYYELWLTKARAWYLYKTYYKRFGFIGLLLRMLDSVRRIIERDEIGYLYNHLYLVRGICDELKNIKLSENACRNTEEDLAYRRKISPYRLMLEYDAVDRIENPRPSFRKIKNKINKSKKCKHKKNRKPYGSSSGTTTTTKGNKQTRRIRRAKGSAHGRLPHLEKKSKSLTTNVSIPSDMAVQELL